MDAPLVVVVGYIHMCCDLIKGNNNGVRICKCYYTDNKAVKFLPACPVSPPLGRTSAMHVAAAPTGTSPISACAEYIWMLLFTPLGFS